MLHRQPTLPPQHGDPVALARLMRVGPDIRRAANSETPAILAGETAARTFFEACFAQFGAKLETLFVAHLDNGARCLHLSHHHGDEAGADLPLRAILLDAARHGSKGLLLAHNHPSGDARPSPSDRHATRRLATAAEAIDLTIVDHLIFAGGQCTSLRRMGLL